ncbi:hypothetical protein LDI01_22330 [Lentilactobacillus diolivorans]|uniref:Secreted protein n=1 Tax=Lentilactobacillus diolivorans TaxID=179838 RepID=A0ABQ0XFF9_9LACO|nr:hypothetical protein LDI01_22330 [Lentilactobacillus diolivorans]
MAVKGSVRTRVAIKIAIFFKIMAPPLINLTRVYNIAKMHVKTSFFDKLVNDCFHQSECFVKILIQFVQSGDSKY